MTDHDVTATELHDHLSECLSRVAFTRERLCVLRHGKVVAVLLSPDDAENLFAAARAAPDAAAGVPREPEEDWALLTRSVKARNYCARCEQLIDRGAETGVPSARAERAI